MPPFWKPDDSRSESRKAYNSERFQPVHVHNLTVIAETERALLVAEDFESAGDQPRQVWVPRSQITNCSTPLGRVEKDDVIDFWIPKWLADEKELMYD